MYSDPLTRDPQSYVYNMFILNTNASFGDGEFEMNEGILIYLFPGSYSVAIVLDSVIAYRNKGWELLQEFFKYNRLPMQLQLMIKNYITQVL